LNVDADRSALAARDCLAAAAREAGALTLGFFRLGAATSAEVQSKFGGSPVTEADLAADALLKRRLREAFPEAGWLSEETADDAERLERRALLVIDPIDGTRAFVAGDPRWAVSAALVVDGRPVAAVVHAPALDETYAAARGAGATLNGKRIFVSTVDTLATSLLCTGFPVHKRLANPNIHYYWDFTLRSHGVRRDGSAALDLASVAAGRFDGFWEFGLKAWDTAAGVLLIEEAGGKVSDFAGEPYKLGGPVVLATNGLIHEEARGVALEISQRDPSAPLHR